MTEPNEQDELESGLQSRFWGRLRAFADREWGPSGETYQQLLRKATQGPVGSEQDAVHRLKVVMAQHDAIQRLLAWPGERVAMLKRKTLGEATVSKSRRGAGL